MKSLHPIRSLLLTGLLLLLAAVGLLLFLNHAKFESTFEQRTRDRQAIVARDIAQTLEAQMALGLTLSDSPVVHQVLSRAQSTDPHVHAVVILDLRGQPVASVGTGAAGLWTRATQQLRYRPMGDVRQGQTSALALPLRNAFEAKEATLVLEYGLGDAQAHAKQAFRSLWSVASVATAVAAAVLLVLCRWLVVPVQGDPVRRNRRMTWLLAALLGVLQSVFAWSAYQTLRNLASEDAPVLTATLAQTALPTLQRALALGIPLNQLSGAQAWLGSVLNAGDEFSRLSVQDANGQVLYTAQATATTSATRVLTHTHPIQMHGQTVGQLVVDLNVNALSERTRQLVIEFVMVLLAAGLLIQEVLRALSVRTSTRDKELAQLRLPLFLFFLGSELPRSFLPVWSKELALSVQNTPPDAWFSPLVALVQQWQPEVLASLPLSVFLLAVAISSPLAGRYCAQHGSRRLFAVGIGIALAGHLLAFAAQSLPALIAARLLAGVAFGAVSMAAFDHIGQQGKGRAAGMALYLSAYVAAGISGAGLGALVADRMGFGQVFTMGMLACFLAWAHLAPSAGTSAQHKLAPPFWPSLTRLLRQPDMLRLMLLVALPLQLVQQGLLFYWAPLALASMGEKTSFAGMAMMAYFLAVLLLNTPVARYADQTGRHNHLVLAGMLISGGVALLGGLSFQPWTVALGIGFVGVAWALAFASQGAIAFELSERNPSNLSATVSIGIYRSVERLAAMLAPVLMAAGVVTFGYAETAVILGTFLVLCALSYATLSRRKMA